MSLAHTTTAPAAPAAGATRRTSLLRWVAGGTTVAAILAAGAIAVWPASEAEKARADGEQLGQAVSALYVAETTTEVNAALDDVQTAAIDARDHAGDAVAEQVAETEDALSRAADGFVGVHSTSDDWDAELYQYELDTAVADLEQQADDLATSGPEVQQAFFDGYESGLAGR
jgi:hypothetical protein